MRAQILVAALAATVAAPLMAGAQSSRPETAAASSGASLGEVRYRLVQVAGRTLPAMVEQELRCKEEVMEGALTLRDDGRWVLETAIRETCGNRVTHERDTDDGTFTREGGTIRFLDDDGEVPSDGGWNVRTDIDLEDLVTGALAGDGTLTAQLADERTTLVFRR